MSIINRRGFIKASGVTALPAIIGANSAFGEVKPTISPSRQSIKLFGDGEMYEPADYLRHLQKANEAEVIEKDRYGAGGAVQVLEKRFAEITGKEAAVFMPTGTMANQFAIAVLSGDHTKVFVQDTSHIYRDEADAAQSVFGKRLMPLAKDKTFFTADELKQCIESLGQEEVFKSGIGAVSIENPVRRSDGRIVPLEEIKKINIYCRDNKIGLHLDGARLYLASAWSGVPLKGYASYFDTVYISLYKYLGASAGAILCGDKSTIHKMTHLMKVHGGSMYGNWTNAAMALYRMDGFEYRLQQTIKRANELFASLNRLPGITVNPLTGGTNIYKMQLKAEIDGRKLQQSLREKYNIRMPGPDTSNHIFITVNETLLYQDVQYISDAFKNSIK